MKKLAIVVFVILTTTLSGDEVELKRFSVADESTKALLERMVNGLGGTHALSRVDSVRSFARIEQEHREEEDPIAIELLSSFPDRHQARVITDLGSLTITINRDDAYIVPARAVIKGVAIRLTDDEKDDLLHYFNTDPVFVVRNVRRPEYRFAAGATQQIDGRNCSELKVEVNGVESSWWIDQESAHVVRSTFRGRQMDFSDFRKVGEITVPFEVTTRLDGKVISRARFARYDINLPVDVNAMFRTPDLWLARFTLNDRRQTTYNSYSSSDSASKSTESSYSGYTYRPPQVSTPDASVQIWDPNAPGLRIE